MRDSEPPKELDGAKVIAYAILDATVRYSGRITMYTEGLHVDPAARLVIARNNHDPGDFLLFYCNESWDVIGAAGYSSVMEAKERAEIAYVGVSRIWREVA